MGMDMGGLDFLSVSNCITRLHGIGLALHSDDCWFQMS